MLKSQLTPIGFGLRLAAAAFMPADKCLVSRLDGTRQEQLATRNNSRADRLGDCRVGPLATPSDLIVATFYRATRRVRPCEWLCAGRCALCHRLAASRISVVAVAVV